MSQDAKPQQYRQGDVLLVPMTEEEVRQSKGHASPVDRDQGRVVLAYGEVTGHAHAIESPAADLQDPRGFLPGWSASDRILDVTGDDVVLRHEEHAAIPLPKGQYRVIRQREYEEGMGSRQVAD